LLGDESTASFCANVLRRTLTLWDFNSLRGVDSDFKPVAPMSSFGALSNRGMATWSPAILIAMVGMLFHGNQLRTHGTSLSERRFCLHVCGPRNSSSWQDTFTGWSMVMDYMLNPLICTIWCAQQAMTFAPRPSCMGMAKFSSPAFFTLLNIRGVKTSARVKRGGWLRQ